MKIAGIICSRMESTRLYGKAMLLLEDKPIIKIIIDKALRIDLINEVIIATANTNLNVIYEGFGVPVYYGSENNVLDRMIKTAEFIEADCIVRLTGDDPIIDREVATITINKFLTHEPDYAIMTQLPIGTPIEIMKTSALKRLIEKVSEPYYLENPTSGFYKYDDFKCLFIDSRKEQQSNRRLTIDTLEDYEVMKYIFGACGIDVTIEESLNYLNKHPEITNINAHIKQEATIGKRCRN